jgi:hypothetical protein
MTIIVKSIVIWNADSAPHEAGAWIDAPTEAVGLYLLFANSLAVLTPLQWQGWVVLDPGARINALLAGSAMAVWASGTILEGLATIS